MLAPANLIPEKAIMKKRAYGIAQIIVVIVTGLSFALFVHNISTRVSDLENQVRNLRQSEAPAETPPPVAILCDLADSNATGADVVCVFRSWNGAVDQWREDDGIFAPLVPQDYQSRSY